MPDGFLTRSATREAGRLWPEHLLSHPRVWIASPRMMMDVADLTGADARFPDRRVGVRGSLRITASLQVKSSLLWRFLAVSRVAL